MLVGLYGGAIGAGAVIVNLLADFQYPDIPEHMPLGRSLLRGGAGALSGLILTGTTAYMIYSGNRSVYKRGPRPRGIVTWFVLGLAFGVVFPLFTGGIFIPLSTFFLDFGTGIVSVPGMLYKSLDLLLEWPSLGALYGFRLMFSGIIGGVLFIPGAWVIDRLNLSEDPTTARYGSWAVALALSVTIIAIVAFGPEATLAKLG
jgi:hypothetical protein